MHQNHNQFRRFSDISWDEAFSRMERTLARRERSRLIRIGHIVPVYALKPQMMVKNADGQWIPEVKYVG